MNFHNNFSIDVARELGWVGKKIGGGKYSLQRRDAFYRLDDFRDSNEHKPIESFFEYPSKGESTIDLPLEELFGRERLMGFLFFKWGLSLAEIGQILGVSETRICQVIKIVRLKIKTFINNTA